MKKNNYYLLIGHQRVKIVTIVDEYVGYIIQDTLHSNPNEAVMYEVITDFKNSILLDLGTNPEYSPDEPNRPF